MFIPYIKLLSFFEGAKINNFPEGKEKKLEKMFFIKNGLNRRKKADF